MNTWLGSIGAVLGGAAAAMALNALSDEIRGQLDLLPRALIRVARLRLPGPVRADLGDEWLAELAAILDRAKPLPVTRLLAGIRFAFGLLLAAPMIARELSGGTGQRQRGIGWAQAVIVISCGLGAAVIWRAGGGFTPVAALPVLLLFPLAAVRLALMEGRVQRQAGDAAMAVLRQAMEAKDLYTLGHCERVSEGAVLLARELGMRDGRVDAIRQAGLLHDFGKLGIPEQVLTKTGRLSAQEYFTRCAAWRSCETWRCPARRSPRSFTITSGLTAGATRWAWQEMRYQYSPGSSRSSTRSMP